MEENVYKKIARLYHNRDSSVFPFLSESHSRALKYHWDGKFQDAQNEYKELLKDHSIGSDKILDLALADSLLLSVKMGTPFDLKLNISLASTYDAQIVMQYAKFYWAFWVDHKIAFKCLKRILLISSFSNCPQFVLTGLFLFFHLKTIAGGNRIQFGIAKLLYKIFRYDILINRKMPHLARNVVVASFPYTQFVAGRFSVKEIETSISFAEQHVVNDPFYSSLVLISGFYGYAYSGNVARTEIFAQRFRNLQKMGKLTRYEPVTAVMRFLPHALRGYGYLIADKFWRILKAHDATKHDPLINSQFYRTSSVIALVLGSNDRASELIELARSERQKTDSFAAWEKIDKRIDYLSKRGRPFNPNEDKIANIEVNFSQPPQLSSILIELISATPSALNKTEEEYLDLVANIVTKHMECRDYSFSSYLGIGPSKNPQLLLGGKILEFTNLEPSRIQYIKELVSALSPMLDHVFEIYKDLVKSQTVQKEAVLVDMATETAHNILGSADDLDSDTENLKFLDEEHKVRHERLIARIQTVANELLSKKRQILLSKSKRVEDTTNFSYTTKPELLSSIVDNVVKERRATTSRDSVNIIWKPKASHYSVFCDINSIEFEVALANLVDNAIDSIIDSNPANRSVMVSIDLQNSFAKVKVTDFGNGISVDALQRVKEKNFTTKPNGNGLGLYHADYHVQKWNGELLISSDPGQTTVTLDIPICVPPKWFASVVVLPKDGKVIIFDDDDGIHYTWQKHLKNYDFSRKKGNLISCRSSKELRASVNKLKREGVEFVLLSDYEIYGERITGLQLIDELELADKAYIVSSYYREDFVTEPCYQKGVLVVPKNIARFSRIFIKGDTLDAVHIDDDDFTHLNWSHFAKENNKKILSFYPVSEAVMCIEHFPKSVPIFVDSMLGNEKGEDASKEIYDLGFESIRISTSSNRADYESLRRPHIIDIVDKTPPWKVKGEKNQEL